MSVRRRRLMSSLWAGAILVSIGLTAGGLFLTFFLFGYPDAFERARSGHALIFLGAVVSAAAAAWARLRGQGWPVTFAVAAPALLVGLPDLANGGSFLTHLGGLIAVPAAFAGMLIGLLGGSPGSGVREPLL
jgi:hypothetical protein